MNILWIESKPSYFFTQAVLHSGEHGLSITQASITDIDFVATDTSQLQLGTCDILKKFDGVVIRQYYDHISDILTLSRLMHDAGKFVIDACLVTQGYAISKMHDYLLLARSGIPVPKSYQPASLEHALGYASKISYPLIVKSIYGSQGNRVYMVEDEDSCRPLWKGYPDHQLIIQEYLAGMQEYRFITIGHNSLPVAIKKFPGKGDFRANYAQGGTFEKIDTDDFPELKLVAEKSSTLLQRECAAIDLCHDTKTNKVYVLEVNRRPGIEGFEETTGYSVAGEFVKYILRKLQATNNK